MDHDRDREVIEGETYKAIKGGIRRYEERMGFRPSVVHLTDGQYSELVREIHRAGVLTDRPAPGIRRIAGVEIRIVSGTDSSGPVAFSGRREWSE